MKLAATVGANAPNMSELARGYTVLVVDDSPVYRKLVEQILTNEPFTLLFAANGSEAMKLVQERSPDIVLTDWMMPDFSGPELCTRIRGRGGEYTYLILMTSDTRETNVVEGLAAGADDYITKPCLPAEMLARIGVGRRIIDLNRELHEKNESPRDRRMGGKTVARLGPSWVSVVDRAGGYRQLQID
jgi:DNA-binding response OmpR family regulator